MSSLCHFHLRVAWCIVRSDTLQETVVGQRHHWVTSGSNCRVMSGSPQVDLRIISGRARSHLRVTSGSPQGGLLTGAPHQPPRSEGAPYRMRCWPTWPGSCSTENRTRTHRSTSTRGNDAAGRALGATRRTFPVQTSCDPYDGVYNGTTGSETQRHFLERPAPQLLLLLLARVA